MPHLMLLVTSLALGAAEAPTGPAAFSATFSACDLNLSLTGESEKSKSLERFLERYYRAPMIAVNDVLERAQPEPKGIFGRFVGLFLAPADRDLSVVLHNLNTLFVSLSDLSEIELAPDQFLEAYLQSHPAKTSILMSLIRELVSRVDTQLAGRDDIQARTVRHTANAIVRLTHDCERACGR